MITRFATLLFGLAVLGGCAPNSIYRQHSQPGKSPVAITVDAKQRLILSQVESIMGTGKDKIAFRRFCAEPSPDAFSVLAQSASGGGSLGLDSTAKTLNAAIQAAFASSETGTTIPRTQTINMLREMMFRTCERYLSGAISKVEVPIIAIRDQRVMVSILAIEQLTGAVTPRPVIINASGSASTGQSTAEAMKLLAAARAELVAADEALAEANGEKSKADTATEVVGGCEALKKLDQPDSTKLAACTKAEGLVAAASEKREAASTFYKQQAALGKAGQGVSGASTTGSGTTSDPPQWSLAQATAVAGVATTVKEIVNKTFDQDETQFFCFKMISDPDVRDATKRAEDARQTAGPTVNDACLNYIVTRVDRDRQVKLNEAKSLGMTEPQFDSAVQRGEMMRNAQDTLVTFVKLCVMDPAKRAKLDAALKPEAQLNDYYPQFKAAIGTAAATKPDLVQVESFVRNLGYNNSVADAFSVLAETSCN